MPPGFGLVAGEASGDLLGAGLIRALSAREPGARFVGVAGPAMEAAGCDAWYPAEQLSVLGLAEVLQELPRLYRFRRVLGRRFLAARPAVFVGIDSPDFNLGLERRLRRQGIATVHYVSPTVWAWRPGRVRTVARAADRVLCLFPFEPEIYARAGVDARFVGHPMADEIPRRADRGEARWELGLPPGSPVLAVLPGSRRGEARMLGPDFARAVALLARRHPGLRFVAPMATPGVRRLFERALSEHAPAVEVMLLDGGARRAMAAADVVLLASGTASLEAALIKRPMVVAYRVAPATRWLLETFRLLKVTRFALPNLIAGRDLVPEYLQDAVTPEALAAAVEGWLDDPAACTALTGDFEAMHRLLARGADAEAAQAVLELAGSGT